MTVGKIVLALVSLELNKRGFELSMFDGSTVERLADKYAGHGPELNYSAIMEVILDGKLRAAWYDESLYGDYLLKAILAEKPAQATKPTIAVELRATRPATWADGPRRRSNVIHIKL